MVDSDQEQKPFSEEKDSTTPLKAYRASGMAVADLLSAPSQSPTDGYFNKSSSQQELANSPLEDDRTSSSHTSSSRHAIANSESIAINEGVAAYQYTAMQQVLENRENVEYKLTIREQPKHSRMCGVGEKADRRPIDPAPIIQLRVIMHDHGPPPPTNQSSSPGKRQSPNQQGENDFDQVRPLSSDKAGQASNSKGSVVSTKVSASGGRNVRRGVPVQTSWGLGWEDKTWYLENPYYFMYAMLADAETDEELHLLQDGKTRYTTGSCVSCLYHLKDIDGSEQGFFVFPDLSIRVEGKYRLKLCLFETIGNEVHHCRSIYSTPFNVYTAKRFPGMEESTMLSRSFADQGLKVRVRRNPRARRARLSGKRKDLLDSEDSSDERLGGGGGGGIDPSSYNAAMHYASGSTLAPTMSSKRIRNEDPNHSYPLYDQQSGSTMSSLVHQRPSEYPTSSSIRRYEYQDQQSSQQRERRYTDSVVRGNPYIDSQQQQRISLHSQPGGTERWQNHDARAQMSRSGPQARYSVENPSHPPRGGEMLRPGYYLEDGYNTAISRQFIPKGSMGAAIERPHNQSTSGWKMYGEHPAAHHQPNNNYARDDHPSASGLPMEEYSSRPPGSRTTLPPLRVAWSPPTRSQAPYIDDRRMRPSSRGEPYPRGMPQISSKGPQRPPPNQQHW